MMKPISAPMIAISSPATRSMIRRGFLAAAGASSCSQRNVRATGPAAGNGRGRSYTDAVERAGDLERLIDLPRAIVWDALLDPVLVEGWLHPTARLLDGDVRERVDPAPDATAVLETVLEPFGRLRFELDERDGGTRGTSTSSGCRRRARAGTTASTAWRTCCAGIRSTGATSRPRSGTPERRASAACSYEHERTTNVANGLATFYRRRMER